MSRYQSILIIFTLTACFACGSDQPVQSPKEIVNKTASAAEKIADSVKEEVKEEVKDLQEEPKSPKLREFYVEEDESKEEPKRTSSSSDTKKTESVKDKVVAKAKPKAASKKTPKMSFTNDTHAFGIIKPGDVIEHKFEFTNTGDADLVVTDAKATCGCTQPSFPFVPIPPGEKGYIGVKYDSTGKLGSQKPTVTITTNGSPKTRKVFLEGIVISELAKKQ